MYTLHSYFDIIPYMYYVYCIVFVFVIYIYIHYTQFSSFVFRITTKLFLTIVYHSCDKLLKSGSGLRISLSTYALERRRRLYIILILLYFVIQIILFGDHRKIILKPLALFLKKTAKHKIIVQKNIYSVLFVRYDIVYYKNNNI